jgi:hypothetical protein
VLTRIDRVQIAVPDREDVAKRWETLLDAELRSEDGVAALGARRTTLALGDSCVELLEPDGSGLIADAISRRGAHLFVGGAATQEFDALVGRLRSKGLKAVVEGRQAHLAPALPLVVTEYEEREPVGLADFIYEVTDLRQDASASAERYAEVFALDASAFVPITSEQYGYTGSLTMFDAGHDRLDRLEVITPTDAAKTMGRFFSKNGESLYMCFCESGKTAEIYERAKEHGAPYTGDANGGFLHPKALGGVMLGISRRTGAWQWSGHPERVAR